MKSDKYPMFSQALRTFRADNEVTQEQFARKVGVTTSAVHKWEQGTNLPDFGKVGQLLTGFGKDGWSLLYAMGMSHDAIWTLCRGFQACDKRGRFKK